ncbi:TGF-beta receptor type-2-like [Aplochiton taeniatus]
MGKCKYYLTVDILFLLSFCVRVSLPFTLMRTNLCKWCEVSSPLCEDRVCHSNCSLSSFCSSNEEICVAIWRQTNDSMSVQTSCHHPSQPLENMEVSVFSNSSSSTQCLMAPQPANHHGGLLFVCGCHGEQECNDILIFDKGSNGFSRLQSKDVIPVVAVSLVPPLLVALLASVVFYLYRTRHPAKQGTQPRPHWPTKRTPGHYLDLQGGPGGEGGALGHDPPDDETDGKPTSLGDDVPEQLPIKLEALVGKGRFAEVWRGRLLQEERDGASGDGYQTVAVKVFPALEYTSWHNERAILSDALLAHDNVVRFISAEQRGPPDHAHRKYWLVLAYHDMGNLQDFLSANVLSWRELVDMAGSVARGLAHLHSDTTPRGVAKVPVAHRDLKGSNIVVKSRTECALCDFGLALRLDLSLNVEDYANSGQVGTARYMAPEVLESRVNLEDLEAFKQMDVYSMALVLWEMTSRSAAIGEVRDYEPAFGSRVCDQPCVDSMRDLVLRDRGRPDIPSGWTQQQGMELLCATITECWDHDPEARLTAPCVVERFDSLELEVIPVATGGGGGGEEGDEQRGEEAAEERGKLQSQSHTQPPLHPHRRGPSPSLWRRGAPGGPGTTSAALSLNGPPPCLLLPVPGLLQTQVKGS